MQQTLKIIKSKNGAIFMDNQNQNESFASMAWMHPETGELTPAGVAIFNEDKGDYTLKISEEPREKKYYLKCTGFTDGRSHYAVDLHLKRADGSFLRRERAGSGFADSSTGFNAHVTYGSKYKVLVVFVSETKNVKDAAHVA